MKLLRIFVYVVLRFPGDILLLIFNLIPFLLIANYVIWYIESEWPEVMPFPFYTTIKTARQIWRS